MPYGALCLGGTPTRQEERQKLATLAGEIKKSVEQLVKVLFKWPRRRRSWVSSAYGTQQFPDFWQSLKVGS